MTSTVPGKPLKVFVSYRHLDGDWVWDRLVPCLRAGGAEVLIDAERFRPGGGVYRQMDAAQDQADRHVLVLSDAYLASGACRHEMERAVAFDPKFEHHIVQPVRRDDCAIPDVLKPADPTLYTDLRDDRDAAAWKKLLDECGAELGTTAPHWLDARDEVVRWLRDNTSVNLLVLGDGLKWRELIEDVRSRPGNELGLFDMHRGVAAARSELIRAMLAECHLPLSVRPEPHDLADFESALAARVRTRLGLLHFDMVEDPQRSNVYGTSLFTALRYQVMEKKNLVLLLQSRRAFGALCPPGHLLSTLDVKTVELKATP